MKVNELNPIGEILIIRKIEKTHSFLFVVVFSLVGLMNCSYSKRENRKKFEVISIVMFHFRKRLDWQLDWYCSWQRILVQFSTNSKFAFTKVKF